MAPNHRKDNSHPLVPVLYRQVAGFTVSFGEQAPITNANTNNAKNHPFLIHLAMQILLVNRLLAVTVALLPADAAKSQQIDRPFQDFPVYPPFFVGAAYLQ